MQMLDVFSAGLVSAHHSYRSLKVNSVCSMYARLFDIFE